MNFIPSNQQVDSDRRTPAWDDRQSNYDAQHDYQYESLTGLLLRENTPASFNDDESFKHHPTFGLEEELRTRRERDEKRRAKSFLKRFCRRVKRTCCKRYDSPLVVLLGLCGIVALGSALGMLMPKNPGDGTTKLRLDWDTISNMLGYTYFLSWTLSFYPQIITNCKRPQDAKRGVSIEFLVWNMIGFACYAAYVTSFMYSDVVRKEYADRFGGGSDDVSSSNSLSKLIPRQLSIVPNQNTWLWSASVQLFTEKFDEELIDNQNQTASSDSTIADSTVDPSYVNTTFSNNTTSQNSSAASDTSNDPIAVPQVKFNDVAFAWHALVLSIISYIQIVWCSKNKHEDTDENEHISSIECSVVQQTQSNIGWVTPQSEDEVFADMNQTEVSPGVGSVLFNEQRQMLLRRQRQSQEIHDQLDSLVESERSYKHKLRSQNMSCTSKILMIILLKFCIVGVLLVLVWSQWQWIDFLYFLSFVKVCISIVKYIPQVRFLLVLFNGEYDIYSSH